ncbi:hypothetical protein BG617_13880 [Lactiplantibacillus paraplantarum]|nr:hypothetical protein BG617_13880 [Lactiplantibacillus paraplantarum]
MLFALSVSFVYFRYQILNLAAWFTVFRSITVMLMHRLNAVVMNALIGTYVIFTLKGLVLSTLVIKI